MIVKEVMTRGVECTRPEASLREAAEKMRQLDVGPLPVCENNRLVGMLTDRDITVRATAEGFPPSLARVKISFARSIRISLRPTTTNDSSGKWPAWEKWPKASNQ